MKKFLLALMCFGCFSAYAGGGFDRSCVPIEEAIVKMKEGRVLDRGGHSVRYEIFMKANRCRSQFETITNKYLFLRYDFPVQRSWEGQILGRAQKFSHIDPTLTIHLSDFVWSSSSQGAENGIELNLGYFRDENHVPLRSVPRGFIGDRTVFITLYGDAFPTHKIKGPFAE